MYQGVRDVNGVASVWITTEQGVHGELPLRLDIRNHSPTGFEWGYWGSGPRQLALAMIAHATGSDEKAEAYSNDFKCAVVGRFLHNGWEMSADDVRECVESLHRRFARELPTLSDFLDADAVCKADRAPCGDPDE